MPPPGPPWPSEHQPAPQTLAGGSAEGKQRLSKGTSASSLRATHSTSGPSSPPCSHTFHQTRELPKPQFLSALVTGELGSILKMSGVKATNFPQAQLCLIYPNTFQSACHSAGSTRGAGFHFSYVLNTVISFLAVTSPATIVASGLGTT